MIPKCSLSKWLMQPLIADVMADKVSYSNVTQTLEQ